MANCVEVAGSRNNKVPWHFRVVVRYLKTIYSHAADLNSHFHYPKFILTTETLRKTQTAPAHHLEMVTDAWGPEAVAGGWKQPPDRRALYDIFIVLGSQGRRQTSASCDALLLNKTKLNSWDY